MTEPPPALTPKPEHWFRSVCDTCVDYIEESLDLVHIASAGVRQISQAGDIVRALEKYQSVRHEGHTVDEDAIAAADKQAALAAREMDRGFPLLHAHALVGLWGAFDAWVEDVLVAWLANRPGDLNDSNRRLKVTAGSVLAGDAHTRARLVAVGIRENLNYSLRYGITPTEESFATVGLDGQVDQDIAETIFRAQQIRHVYAHSGGRADERFLKHMPHLGLNIGDSVPVNHEAFMQFATALIRYVTEVFRRGQSIIRNTESGAGGQG